MQEGVPVDGDVITGEAAFEWMRQNPDDVVPLLVEKLWPVGMAAFYLAAVFCAAMSTADGLLHFSAASIAYDLGVVLRGLPVTEQQLRRTIPIVTAGAGVVAWLLALLKPGVVYALFAFGIALPASTCAAPLFRILSDRVPRWSAVGGAIAGLIACATSFAYAWIRAGTPTAWGYYLVHPYLHPYVLGIIAAAIVVAAGVLSRRTTR